MSRIYCFTYLCFNVIVCLVRETDELLEVYLLAFEAGRFMTNYSFLMFNLMSYDLYRIDHIFENLTPLQILKDFLLWVDQDLGAWGPLVL